MIRAIASTRYRKDGHLYSAFHRKLTQNNQGNSAALAYLYSRENLRYLLLKKNLVKPDLAENYFYRDQYTKQETIVDVLVQFAVIDVWKSHVWIKLPAWLPITETEAQAWMFLNRKIYAVRHGVKVRKNPFGLCRIVSKNDFIEAAIARCDAETSETLQDNGDLTYSTQNSETITLKLEENGIVCSCSHSQHLANAFREDPYLQHRLYQHPVLRGQLPDPHVFAVWRNLGVKDFSEYQFEYYKLVLRSHSLSTTSEFNRYGNPHLSVYRDQQKIGDLWKRRGEGNVYWIAEPSNSLEQNMSVERQMYRNFADGVIALLHLAGMQRDRVTTMHDQ